MKIYETRNNKITALSALKRRSSAPQLVVVAPSGSGKSTLIYLLLNHKIIPYMRIGIGEKSQTTIIPCEFCFDERIEDEETFAIQIIMKDFTAKDIHMSIITVLMDLFAKNDCDVDETIEAFDEKVFSQVLEPGKAHYHLGQIKNKISLEEIKDILGGVLRYMDDNDFNVKVIQRRDKLKSKKVKLSEVREMIFEEMFETMPEDGIKAAYFGWLDKIGKIIKGMLLNILGETLCSQEMVQYNLQGDNNGTMILQTLFDPFTPYSLVIDYISIACKPRQELIDIAQEESPELPFRFCIRDTMGLTQKGIDATSTKEGLEAALNCRADTILFLLSLEERDDTLTECCRALVEKKEALKKKNLDTSVYVLFTKADRKVENLINKRNSGDLYIDEDTYKDNIQEVLADMESMVSIYADALPQEDVSWLSMRYLKESYILKSLDNDERKLNFQPKGLFRKIVGYSMKTLKRTLPKGVNNPLFVTAIEPDRPVVQVVVDPYMMKAEINSIQQRLSREKDIVEGYVISDKTPRLHGCSVYSYWNKLMIGLGHTTRASVYGNFSINMKGLVKRMLTSTFPSFEKFHENRAVKLTADNLEENVLVEVLRNLTANDELGVGLNPALGARNIALQRLYEFCVDYFTDASRFATLIDRIAYDLSYGNQDLKQILTDIYNKTPEYDGAMRKLQRYFKKFFESDEFVNILISEFNQVMTEMINKLFIII